MQKCCWPLKTKKKDVKKDKTQSQEKKDGKAQKEGENPKIDTKDKAERRNEKENSDPNKGSASKTQKANPTSDGTDAKQDGKGHTEPKETGGKKRSAEQTENNGGPSTKAARRDHNSGDKLEKRAFVPADNENDANKKPRKEDAQRTRSQAGIRISFSNPLAPKIKIRKPFDIFVSHVTLSNHIKHICVAPEGADAGKASHSRKLVFSPINNAQT